VHLLLEHGFARTFGTLSALSAATTSLRMPRVLGMEDSGPTQTPSYTPWPRCSANWPNTLRSIFAPALDASTDNAIVSAAAAGAMEAATIEATLRTRRRRWVTGREMKASI
jgi:hypothetical protein